MHNHLITCKNTLSCIFSLVLLLIYLISGSSLRPLNSTLWSSRLRFKSSIVLSMSWCLVLGTAPNASNSPGFASTRVFDVDWFMSLLELFRACRSRRKFVILSRIACLGISERRKFSWLVIVRHGIPYIQKF